MAQSFFQTLFGWAGPKPSGPAPVLRGIPPGRQAVPNAVPGFQGGAFRQYVPSPRQATAPAGGKYTTMCVRMCDGFYFPISHSTSRGGFSRDAAACQDRCANVEARLFYRPASSSEMKDAVDLTGRVYGRLPIAFKHRKTYVKGCTCRPAPWSAAERVRHRSYAVAAGVDVGPEREGLETPQVIAGHSGTGVSTVTVQIADTVEAQPQTDQHLEPTAAGAVEAQRPEAAPEPTVVEVPAVAAPSVGVGAAATKPVSLTAASGAAERRGASVRRARADATERRGRRSTRNNGRQYSSGPGVIGLFGAGQQQKRYTWPGDRPTSYR